VLFTLSASVNPKEEMEKSNAVEVDKMRKVLRTSLLPISRIPGIRQSTPDTLQVFEDSKFIWLLHKDHEVEFAQLFRLVNEVAPFYHPKR
jgi:hypothetical protein